MTGDGRGAANRETDDSCSDDKNLHGAG